MPLNLQALFDKDALLNGHMPLLLVTPGGGAGKTALAVEGLHNYFGRDTGGGLRKGIASHLCWLALRRASRQRRQLS